VLFNELGLSAELLRAVEQQGYNEATPIQQKAIPLVLEGKDILAGAQTGTGKTAGFTLPILSRLQAGGEPGDYPRVLILTPTRELAAQVEQSVVDYGRYLPFKSLTIFGGVSSNMQKAKLRKGCDIVVATPGRLLDLMQQKAVDLSSIEILVLDEADRMLDMGFIRDMRKIFKELPKKRQTLLFSATFNKEIRSLGNDLLNNPVEVQVTPTNSTAEKVSQFVYPVEQKRKRELLAHRIGTEQWKQVLVFTRTKRGANRLSEQLAKDGITATAIHGNKSQGARTKALAQFKAGKVRVLVATDIAARGLDIKELPYVVNYELPNVPEDYVHRIGRTARAGQDGHAISLVSHDEQDLLRDIEGMLKQNIEQVMMEGYEPQHWSYDPQKKGRTKSRSGGSRASSSRRNGSANGSAAKGSGNGAAKKRRRKPANKAGGRSASGSSSGSNSNPGNRAGSGGAKRRGGQRQRPSAV